MIWSSTCRCTVGFSIGTSVSTRRSKLRGIQSAEEMKTFACGDGSPLPSPKQTIRAVLEEAPDDALDPDVLRQARHPGPQAADAAHDEVDLHAGLARRVERVDDRRSTSEFILAQIGAGRPARACAISSSISSSSVRAG